MMTMALVTQTKFTRRAFILTVPDFDPFILWLFTSVILLISAGLLADLALGLVLGTLALWPAALALGLVIGFLYLEISKCLRNTN